MLNSRAGLFLRNRLPRAIQHLLRLARHVVPQGKPAAEIPPGLFADCRVCASRRELVTKFPKGARVAEIGDVPRQLRPPHSLSLRARRASRHRSRAQLDPEVAEDPRVRVHYCTSHIVLSGFPDAHFDWIYVDADHSYEGLLRDANAAATKVKPGGFLVFNDFAHADPFLGAYGVQRAVADFVQSLADCLARLSCQRALRYCAQAAGRAIRQRMSRGRVAVLALGVLLLCGAPYEFCAAREAAKRVHLAATYRVEFGAFNLGDFHLTATLAEPKYELKAKGKFSFISGMIYRASGRTETTGKFSKNGAEPSQFEVIYKGGSKKEERRFNFVNGAVDQISVVPPKKPRPRNVPLAPDQLKNVLDPLTAAFLSVRAKGSSSHLEICKRTVPVFDGRQRFDIVLTPKRSEPMPESAPAGVSGPLSVCRVKFVPIGGYRPDHPGIKFMTQTEDIEVWLVSVPRTDFYIPYRILLPTAWANGVATLSEIELH